MIYRVILYTPKTDGRGWEVNGSWFVGNERVAELTALARLGTAFESAYGYKVNRRPFCEVRAAKPAMTRTRYEPASEWTTFPHRSRGPHWRFTVEQPVRIVPSVGELGWTP